MRTYKYIAMIIMISAFCSVSNTAFCQKKDTLNVRDKIVKIEESVSEIRRDQLNYKIERDLLKETFSSNYQTINIVLAIVLVIFSVFGFLGIRDIGAIKEKYGNELDKLNKLRADFELKITKYQVEQDKVKEEYFAVLKTNDEQNRRIKVLELQEKVSSLIKGNSYQRALEYVIPALNLDPDNQILLAQKGMCLWRLGDLPGATAAFEKVVQLDQSNISAVGNLLELYLIKNSLDEFHGLYSKNKALIVSHRPDATAVTTYLGVLEAYQLGDVAKMKSLAEGYLKSLTSEKEKRSEWDFRDVKKLLAPKQEEPKGAILNMLLSVITGDMERGEAMRKISDVA